MNHNYAKKKLTSLLIDLNSYTADEFRREMARIITGATGQDVPDDCHTIKAERDAQAEAGRAGFIAGFKESGEGFNGEYGASEKRIYELANEYIESVRQGGTK